MFLKKKVFWIILAALVLAVGGGYAYYTYVYKAGQESAEPTIATTQARRGDMVLSVSGSGTLIPASEVALGFESSGYLEEVFVEVGDRVQEGDVLAKMETKDLELAIGEADNKVRLAQLDLDDVLAGPSEAELANAKTAIQNAQTALEVAQRTYDSKLNSDFDSAARAAYLNYLWRSEQYLAAKEALANGEIDQRKSDEASRKWREAEAQLNDALKDVKLEQLEVANDLDQARNNVYQAMERLETLQSGPTEDEVRKAELALDEANLAAEEARANLEAATLRAPFDGTVIEVTAIPGESVGAAAFITLADLDAPLLEFWVEEADMSGVVVGNRVEIEFEALPDDTFSGEVTDINPTLVTVGRTLAVQAWAKVDTTSYSGKLLSGMNADVEVISAESRGVVIVPVRALRELGQGKYAVFVVQPDGELEMRLVEVGLKDLVNAEIVSGLEVGEVVSTGIEESTGTGTSTNEQQMPGFGGERIFEGGGGPGGPPAGGPGGP